MTQELSQPPCTTGRGLPSGTHENASSSRILLFLLTNIVPPLCVYSPAMGGSVTRRNLRLTIAPGSRPGRNDVLSDPLDELFARTLGHLRPRELIFSGQILRVRAR